MSEKMIDPNEAIEQWRPIVDWPEYEVSNLGRVKRVRAACGATTGSLLNPWRSRGGYLMVGLSRGSKVKTMLVHRLVAMTLIGDPSGQDVCHNNGIRTDNRVENLRIDSRKGNMSDIYRHDTHIRGERCGTNKYSEGLMRKIKAEIASGGVVRQIAAKYGIPATTLYGVAQGRTWRWL